MAAPQASSRLEMLQARFQQRQLIEKEQKLLQLYDQQQLRAHQVAQRGSAGSNGSSSSGHGTIGGTTHHHQTVTRTSTTAQSTSNSQGGGKVRQMFDERRQTTVKGIDKSYPLEPLDNRSRKQQTTIGTTSNVVVSSSSPLKNGNPMSNRQSVVTRRTVRSEANSNINGGRPMVSYHEEVSRESCGPTEGANELEEFGDENDQVSRYANGNPQIDQRGELHIEDVRNENTSQRHRTTAKIHLAGFNNDNGTNRVGDDLENEQFPDDLATNGPDRLPRRGPAAKKPSQAEARLERFKNSNTKRPSGKTTKQVAGNATSFTKRRTETTIHSGSSSRASTVTRTMEEDTSRASSTSPELVVRAGRPRSSSPEVADGERNSTSPVDRRSSVTRKSSGISKVSQLTHRNSMDFYPRRKSEFEKSKTFRKLQLELGESSPEPAMSELSESTGYSKHCRKRGSVLEPNIYSLDRRSSSPSPAADRDRSRDRRCSREQTPEAPKSRGGSESPVYRRKSTTTSVESKTTNLESNIYSCHRRASSSYGTTDRDFARGRRASREKSPGRPQPRRGSGSPFYGRKSSLANEDKERSNVDTRSSRRRSSSTSPIADRDSPNARRASHESSPERPASRGGCESPVYRGRSTVTSEEVTTTRAGSKVTSEERRVTREESTGGNESPGCVRVTRKRSESPRGEFPRSSVDREETRSRTDSRKKSGETLRSVELVKKLVRSGGPGAKTATPTKRSSEPETTLEDVEFPVHSVNRNDGKKRAKSPEHKVVKKDKAAMEASAEESKTKDSGRENSSDTSGRTAGSRSRTVSPSPPRSTTMKETASFRAKKKERRSSPEAKKRESKHRREERRVNETNKINLSYEGPKKWEHLPKTRSPSPEEDRRNGSRRSSSETTVRRHDTFKVSRPGQRTIKVEGPAKNSEEESIDKKIKADQRDKSQLLERIENIRTTISKSGRSEQNFQSKDFERTDSVESALRRFDSIGVETEHRITVGFDETDILPVNSSSKETTDVAKIVTKKPVDSRAKPSKTTVAVVKAQPRKIETKARVPSKEKLSRVNLREKHSDSARTVKVGKEKSATATTAQRVEDKVAPKSRVSRKIATSLVRKSQLRGEEPSGRGEGKASDRSPSCKRRLFEDSESEIDTDNSRSTVVLSTTMRVTKGPEVIGTGKPASGDELKAGSEDIIRSESFIAETKTDFEQPTTVLRSIEDIRKSIKRESQDFRRELNKFNTAMRRDAEEGKSARADSSVSSGIISRVEIKKTLKSVADDPVIEIGRSTVKLPIAHRVAKSPSPDIGGKRSAERRARTPTASVRRSVPSSPAKSPDGTIRYGSAEFKSTGSKLLPRPSTSPSSLREDGNRSASSRTSVCSDFTDGPGNDFQSTITESVFSMATKTHEAFVVELEDDEVSGSKDDALSKPPLRKKSSETSLTSQKQQRSPTTTPLPRPTSALSTASSVGSTRGQASHNKIKMATKTKSPASAAPRGPPGSARGSTAAAVNDGLAPCKICGRRFNSDRITLHEQICSKTATKKRKQFDATTHRVKGTELEPFVKKGGSKKPQADRKSQKPEVKSNWRRKHEDFINAIRSAKQVQAHLAAGGKLSDLPPPPVSDTSDYVQCPHCGRKFNQGAADRHIPKCQTMLHNKPNPRAPPKPKR